MCKKLVFKVNQPFFRLKKLQLQRKPLSHVNIAVNLRSAQYTYTCLDQKLRPNRSCVLHYFRALFERFRSIAVRPDCEVIFLGVPLFPRDSSATSNTRRKTDTGLHELQSCLSQ